MSLRTISSSLVKAYNDAQYVVESELPFHLKINEVSLDLKFLMTKSGARTSAFITAFNPYSQIYDDFKNGIAQDSLINDVHKLGYKFVMGYGQDYEDKWPRESSILILGITEHEGNTLADKYEQNGYLWVAYPGAACVLNLRLTISD